MCIKLKVISVAQLSTQQNIFKVWSFFAASTMYLHDHSIPGLKITAGHRTMSGQDDFLSGQNLGLAVILTGHVRTFQITTRKKIFALFLENINS